LDFKIDQDFLYMFLC